MSETEALLAAGRTALRTLQMRGDAAVRPELHVAEDPAAWHADIAPCGPAIAMSPLLTGRLAEGVDFMGPEDPDVAGHWAGHGFADGGVEAMRRLMVPHRWSMDRVERDGPAESTVLRLDAVTQSALCSAVSVGVPVVFDAPTPGPGDLTGQSAIATGTAREAQLECLLSDPMPLRMACFVMPPEVWERAGAPLFSRAEFQFSQVVACHGPGEIQRDVLDEWFCVLRGRVEVALWPPGVAEMLSPLGALASCQVAHPVMPMAPVLEVALRDGQWLVLPHGWFKQVRPLKWPVAADVTKGAAVLRHFWRF